MVGSSPRFVACFTFAVALAAAAAGCKQGDGERCEINTDCEDGSYCDPSGGDNSGGICKPLPDAGTTPIDAAAETGTDVPVEMTPATDGGDAAMDVTTETAPDADAAAETAADAPVEMTPADGPAAETGG